MSAREESPAVQEAAGALLASMAELDRLDALRRRFGAHSRDVSTVNLPHLVQVCWSIRGALDTAIDAAGRLAVARVHAALPGGAT